MTVSIKETNQWECSLDAASSAALHVLAFASIGRVLRQLLGGSRRLPGNPFDTASKRFQFGRYEVPIHICLRVAKIRR